MIFLIGWSHIRLQGWVNVTQAALSQDEAWRKWAVAGVVVLAAVGSMALWFYAWEAMAIALALLLVASLLWPYLQAQVVRSAAARGLEGDGEQAFLSDARGRILYRNPAARMYRPLRDHADLQTALAEDFADPAQLLATMFKALAAEGSAREDHATRSSPVLLTAVDLGYGIYLWRRFASDRDFMPWPRENDPIPMARRDSEGMLVNANAALRRSFGMTEHETLIHLGGLNPRGGLMLHVDTPNGRKDFLVAELIAPCGREVLFLPSEMAFGDASNWDLRQDFPVAILKLSPEGRILGSNIEARKLLPMPFGPESRFSDMVEGLGRSISDWLHDTYASRAAAPAQFLRGTSPHEDFFLRVALHPVVSDHDGHILAVLSDMTEMKSLEAQFVQSQKMQAIGQLAGGVAHDFNNLLTAIAGYCDLMLLRRDRSDPDYPDLIQIHHNTNRAASLVGQLLAFSRKQSLMPAVLDMRDTLADLTHLLNRLVGERVRLTLIHDPDLKRVRADKRQLEQVLMNLVVNARDAMPQGGEIRIETEHLVLTDPLIRDRAQVPAGPYVVIKVIDSGHGIAPDRLTKIFEPFYTTKRMGEGTGLGLSTAYGIIKQTGGYIFVDSELDAGTVFSIFLPASDAEPSVTATAHPSPQLSGLREGVVLLVEDEAPVRAFASRALGLRGLTVIDAESAEAALEILKDPDLHIDIIVTDVIMPGLDGPTWVRRALQDRPDTRVIFMSGYAEDAFAEQKATIPHSIFLPKPFSLAELTAVVEGELK